MAAIAQKRRRRSTKKAQVPEKASAWPALLLSLAAGACLGFSAPGFDQWYLAFAGLAPLLLLTAAADRGLTAFVRGGTFALAYNLVYLNWYLHLAPLDWLGFDKVQGQIIASLAWIVVSLHQSLITGAFCLALKKLPTGAGFLPTRAEDGWKLPSLILIPALWVLLHNKLLNHPDLLGVPWSMIEYSQYRNLPFIQCASTIGGIGIGFFLVLINAALAELWATLSARPQFISLAAASGSIAARHALTVALAAAVVYAAGLSSMAANREEPGVPVCVLQTNVNIEMQKTAHRFTLKELLERHAAMLGERAGSFVFLTENSIPTYLKNERYAQDYLKRMAVSRQANIVVGALDSDDEGHPYNSAFGITEDGRLLPAVYHKRYLVPFGEYMPPAVAYMPEWIQRLTNTPAGGGFASGKQPVLLNFKSGAVAPSICFESMSPELVAASVRRGGGLLVNLTDLAWFHDSMIGDQMLAFAVFRAIENRRYMVFAANSGPSALIDPAGRILKSSQRGVQVVLAGQVAFRSGLTAFTSLFR